MGVVVLPDKGLGRGGVDPLHAGIAWIKEFAGGAPTLTTVTPPLALTEIERERDLMHDQARTVERRSSSGTSLYGVKRVAPVMVLIWTIPPFV